MKQIYIGIKYYSNSFSDSILFSSHSGTAVVGLTDHFFFVNPTFGETRQNFLRYNVYVQTFLKSYIEFAHGILCTNRSLKCCSEPDITFDSSTLVNCLRTGKEINWNWIKITIIITCTKIVMELVFIRATNDKVLVILGHVGKRGI